MKIRTTNFIYALAISLSAAACSGNKSGGSADSTKVDSSVSIKTTDSSVVTTDPAHRDTAKIVADTPKLKIDSPVKNVTKKTVVKKVTLKKH